MIKLYRITDDGVRLYWETWDNEDGTFTVHRGELGTEGETRTLEPDLTRSAAELAEEEARALVEAGYDEPETIYVLKIEYELEDRGAAPDQERLHRLEEQLNETLGWTGLGHCAGGAIAPGVMEIFCLVVDFDLAKQIVTEDLKETEFSGYSTISEDS